MRHYEFISQLDEKRIVNAITAAEEKCSGEIRVYVSRKERHDVFEFARKRFQQLGMFRTRDRNAVLLYIVPRTQQFAVVGDDGIHEKCGEVFWNDVADGMSAQMKAGRFTEAIIDAVQGIGATLAKHFPRAPDDRNELPNTVIRD